MSKWYKSALVKGILIFLSVLSAITALLSLVIISSGILSGSQFTVQRRKIPSLSVKKQIKPIITITGMNF